MLYTLSGPDAMYFGIYRGTGQIISQTMLDYESGKTEFTVMVTATDKAGLSDTTEVTINLVDVNEPPVPIDGLNISDGPSEVNHSEDSDAAIGTYMVEGIGADSANWSVEGTDGSLFMVAPASGNSTMLSFRSMPNYEMPMGGANDDSNTYMVTVKATDSSDSTIMDTMDVMVTVVDADDDGSVTVMPMSAMVGTELTATLEDEDSGMANTTWQWARSDAMAGTYTDIAGATMATYTAVEADSGMYLMATATYDDDHGTGKMVSSEAVMVSADVSSRYDTDGTPGISLPEMFNAIDDYFEGMISIAEMFEVIDAYFNG